MDIEVRKSSISGQGIFALKLFKLGTPVLVWNPKILTKHEVENLPESEKHYIDSVDGEFLYMQAPERYINHSCNPNTKIKNKSDVAIRDIKVGEEITSDYSGGGAISFKCNCGSRNCRGIVK